MRTIKFIAYLFYRYYSTGPTKRIPYFSTLCALALIALFHIFQILIILNATDFLPASGAKPGMDRLMKYIEWAIFTAPLFLLLSLLIKKKELETMHYDERKIKRGYIVLIIYIILSFSFMIFLALVKKGRI